MFAQDYYYQYDWTGCGGMNTKITGVLTIDGVEVYNGVGMENAGGGQLEIGVFDQDEICRGRTLPLWRSKSNQWVYQMQFRGVQGYTVYHFKVYDHATETELDLVDDFGEEITYQGNYTYQWNGANSGLNNLYHLNFTNPNQPAGLTLEIEPYSGENDHYYLIASPYAVKAEAVQGLMTPEYDFYSFDQQGDDEHKEWITHKDNPDYQFVPGMGYLYANNTGTDLVFNGTAPDGDVMEFELTYATGEFIDWAGWNLVGNPFEVSAYPNMPFYTMNENGDGYLSHAANEELPMLCGAFVQAESTGENVVMSKTAQGKSAKLNLNLSNSHGVIDRAIVSFGQGKQLSKFMFRENSTKVYIPVEGKDYAVVHIEGMGEMPVNFKAKSNGSYTLSFTAEEVSFAYLHLIDNLTGADVDMLSTPSYTFNARVNDYDSRFKLVFATGNNGNEDTFAFFSNGNFIINNEGEAALQVVDVTGRILKDENINGCTSVNVNAAPGVYMLRLVNGDNVKVQKVVVR